MGTAISGYSSSCPGSSRTNWGWSPMSLWLGHEPQQVVWAPRAAWPSGSQALHPSSGQPFLVGTQVQDFFPFPQVLLHTQWIRNMWGEAQTLSSHSCCGAAAFREKAFPASGAGSFAFHMQWPASSSILGTFLPWLWTGDRHPSSLPQSRSI